MANSRKLMFFVLPFSARFENAAWNKIYVMFHIIFMVSE